MNHTPFVLSRRFLVSLCLCLLAGIPVSAGLFEENPRFRKILELYGSPRYFYERRKIDGDISYVANRTDSIPLQQGLDLQSDDVQSFDRTIDHSLNANVVKIFGKGLTRNRIQVGGYIDGSYNEQSFVRSNELLDRKDQDEIVNKSFEARGILDIQAERYWKQKRIGKHRFVDTRFSVEPSVIRSTENRSSQYELTTTNPPANGGWRYSNVNAKAGVDGMIGLGKSIDIEPVFKAFQVERVLREGGILANGELTDSTLVNVAWAIAKRGYVNSEMYDRPSKYTYQDIEKAILRDPDLKGRQLSAWMVMKIEELVDRSFPEIRSGFRFGIDGAVSITVGFEDADDLFLEQENRLSLALFKWWGMIHPQLWIKLQGGPVLSTNSFESFYPNAQVKSFLDGTTSAALYYFLNDFVLFEAEVGSIPFKYVVVPDGAPDYVHCGLDIQFENQWSLTVDFRRQISSRYPYDSRKVRTHESVIKAGISYDF